LAPPLATRRGGAGATRRGRRPAGHTGAWCLPGA